MAPGCYPLPGGGASGTLPRGPKKARASRFAAGRLLQGRAWTRTPVVAGPLRLAALPLLLLRLPDAAAARAAEARLRAHRPAIHVNQGRLREGILVVNPLALAERDLATLGRALAEVLRP